MDDPELLADPELLEMARRLAAAAAVPVGVAAAIIREGITGEEEAIAELRRRSNQQPPGPEALKYIVQHAGPNRHQLRRARARRRQHG